MKKIGSTMYVHKTNIDELLSEISTEDAEFIQKVIKVFDQDYAVVKFDAKTKRLSLIESPNWDEANEPDVGTSYCFSDVSCETFCKIIKPSGKIYHNKWVFVAADYDGFDIDEAMRRTEEWNAIPDILEHKKKIGNKKYWKKLLEANGMSL